MVISGLGIRTVARAESGESSPPALPRANSASEKAIASYVRSSESRAILPTETDSLDFQATYGNDARNVLQAAIEKAQDHASIKASNIQFSIDDEFGKMTVKIVDQSTQEVIRQIPSREMLEISQALERMQGLFVSEKA